MASPKPWPRYPEDLPERFVLTVPKWLAIEVRQTELRLTVRDVEERASSERHMSTKGYLEQMQRDGVNFKRFVALCAVIDWLEEQHRSVEQEG